MKRNNGHRIAAVEPGSAAEELEIAPGDWLMAVNGKEIEDVFDYRYQTGLDTVSLLIRKPDGELWDMEIENGGEDPGLVFESGLMSEYRSCSNACIFCFIDQMPKGMRETLYFKDDDSRLSFLQGNYITLTNMKEKDIQHIIDYRLEPINISVHTTNPELRCRMLHNRFAGRALQHLETLFRAGIRMNGQIVLCKDWNDGEELTRTLTELLKYAPLMESVSVVPVGLTDYREGLCPLKPLEKEDALRAVETVEKIQREAMRLHRIHFAHASDELYLKAELPLPEARRYDGYLQLENGVGMLRLLEEEVTDALESTESLGVPERISAVSGALAAPAVARELERIGKAFPEKKIRLIPVENRFFGPMITVTGLLTGADLLRALKDQDLGDRLLLPQCMFRSGEEVLLDDVTKEELERALQVRCVILGSSGQDLVDAVNDPEYCADSLKGEYELPDSAAGEEDYE